MSKTLYYKAKNIDELRDVLTALVSVGCKIHHDPVSVDYYVTQYGTSHPVIEMDSDKVINGCGDRLSYSSFEEFFMFAIAKSAQQEVVLNSTYTAVVTKEGVKVGCQNFGLGIIDKLAEAKKKMLEG